MRAIEVAQVLADGYKEDADGLIYQEYTVGSGEQPTDGQEVRRFCCIDNTMLFAHMTCADAADVHPFLASLHQE